MAKHTAPKIVEENTETEQETEQDFTQLDPNTVINVTVVCQQNAGKDVGTRWGRTKFETDGTAKMNVRLADLYLLNQLKWLSQADQEKYLGLEEAAPPSAVEGKNDAELEAVKAANVRMAMRCADLEAKIDQQDARFNKAYSELQGHAAASDAENQRTIADLTAQLALASATKPTSAPDEAVTTKAAADAKTIADAKTLVLEKKSGK